MCGWTTVCFGSPYLVEFVALSGGRIIDYYASFPLPPFDLDLWVRLTLFWRYLLPDAIGDETSLGCAYTLDC